MVTGIIELNDAGVRVSTSDQASAEPKESAGVAVISDKGLLLGESALAQSRLQPLRTNSMFWHRLSAEPLPVQSSQFRHHADLAYSHLLSLHEFIPDAGQVVFAVPGTFTRQQMSLLLGIVSQCPFDAVGLVDSAVAASAAYARSNSVLHMDIQLHQCVITELEAQDGLLERGHVEVFPECGLLTLRDRWAKAVADQFIDQSRFDPFHSAVTEQSLYDQLPTWMAAYGHSHELILEVGGKSIKLAREQFVRAVEPLYQQILSRVRQLWGEHYQVLLSDRLAALPGLKEAFASIASPDILPASAVMDGISRHLAHIAHGEGEQLSFIQALPCNTADHTAPAQPAPEAIARTTHLLCGHTAYPLSDLPLYLDLKNARPLDSATGAHCSVQRQGEEVLLIPLNGDAIHISKPEGGDLAIKDNHLLYPGDRIGITSGRAAIRLIEVVPGHGP